MINTLIVACFIASVVLFVAACVLAWWGFDERKYSLRLKRRLHVAERCLATYREWADDLSWAVQSMPEDQEGTGPV